MRRTLAGRSLGGRPLGGLRRDATPRRRQSVGEDVSLTAEWNFLLPAGVAISRASKNGAPDLTFTRASSGWYWNGSGVLVEATTDNPRFDQTAFTGMAALGLLIEMGRTNSMLWNRDLTNAAYDTVTNITAVKDATGIDGVANSASTLTADAANGVIRQSITLGSAARTLSIFVKRKTGTGDIDITDNGGSNYTTLTGLSSSAWTRHNITRTQANPDVGFRIVTSGDAIEVDFGQVEGGLFETSPILTTTTSVPRAADVCSTTDLGWFNTSSGTFFADYILRSLEAGSGAASKSPFDINDGSSNNTIRVLGDETGGDIRIQYRSGSSLIANFEGGTPSTSGNKVATAYKVDDFVAYSDGSELATAVTSGAVPTGLTKLQVGNGTLLNPLNGTIKILEYWNVRKPNGFLVNITS